MSDGSKEPVVPIKSIKAFVWFFFILGVVVFLLCIDEVGVFTGDRVLTWSFWRWLTAGVLVAFFSLGINLALRFWVEKWKIQWVASIKKKVAKKLWKAEAEERVYAEMSKRSNNP